ncbi:MAG: IS3 family transposase, partial [Nitrososphaera sp.]|nr:IS3 family transposase [Nitrososphaera sp.]
GKEYPKATVGRVLGTSRSSRYYAPKAVDDSQLEADIHKVCAQGPCSGYRRVTAELTRRGWLANRKPMARLMTQWD